jgi:hypothetical protein
VDKIRRLSYDQIFSVPESHVHILFLFDSTYINNRQHLLQKISIPESDQLKER